MRIDSALNGGVQGFQRAEQIADKASSQIARLNTPSGDKVQLPDELAQLNLPWLRVYGRLDSLVPKASIPLLDERYPASRSVVLEKASHAPFISHPQQFIEIIEHFVG